MKLGIIQASLEDFFTETQLEDDKQIEVHSLVSPAQIEEMDGLLIFKSQTLELFEVISWTLKATSLHLPIWILMAKNSIEERRILLQIGAAGILDSDYSLEEVLLVVKNNYFLKKEKNKLEIVKNQDIMLNSQNGSFIIDDTEISLTRLEFKLMNILCKDSGIVYSYEQLATALWGKTTEMSSTRISNIVCHIRTKLGHVNKNYSKIIKTVRSKGYLVVMD